MDFGEKIKTLRVERGFSQQRVADEMNISQAKVTALERGARKPSLETIRAFAAYYRVPESELVPFEMDKDSSPVQKIASTLHENPKLALLFDKTKLLSENDLDVVISVVKAIAKERDDE